MELTTKSVDDEAEQCAIDGHKNKDNNVKSTDHNADDDHDNNVTPDDILHQLGGCGTFQIILVLVVHAMKTVVCWSMMGNALFAYRPRWNCVEDASTQHISNDSIFVGNYSAITISNSSSNSTADGWTQQCNTYTGKSCTMFEFEAGTRTFVTEFDLVCDYAWVPAAIMSIQMLGMCVGSIVSGQLADMFGRKVPYFASMVLLFLFHLVTYFATSWIVIAVARFFIGLGCAFYLAICYTILTEYSLSKWRSVITGMPTWAIESGLFAVVAWWLRDWKHLTLCMVVLSLVSLTAWFYVPESFRWYMTQRKYDQAEALVVRISKWNKHPAPDFQRMRKLLSEETAANKTKKYSVLVLFRKIALLKITLPLLIIWCTIGFVSYGINFGVQNLSGDIYMNLFLFGIVAMPSKMIAIFLMNRQVVKEDTVEKAFGRKLAAGVALLVCMLGGLAVGIIQHIDTPMKDSLTNYCALAASAGVDATWGPVQTITLELYPTVVRNTGFGFVSILARVGAVVAPQFVYLSQLVPGLLYFAVATLSFLSILGAFLLPETNNTILIDQLEETNKRRKETRRLSLDSP